MSDLYSGEFQLTNAIEELWSRANITDEKTLLKFSGMTEYAKSNIANLVNITAEIGALVVDDVDVGSFQSKEDVSELLFNLSAQLASAHAILNLASMADHKLFINNLVAHSEVQS